MSLFAGPEHESYIALCRDLDLDHVVGEGDYFITEHPSGLIPRLFDPQLVLTRDSWWAPRSDQLDDMLEEVGVTSMRVERLPSNGWYRVYPNPTRDEYGVVGTMPGRDGLMTGGPSHEEAKLRLWMLVTGRKVGA